MSFSPFMGEFIYSGHPWPSPFGPVFDCSNPHPADLVFWIILTNQRKAAPMCWPTATLRASVWTGRGELAALRHAPHYSGPAFQCSTTQKGIGGQRLTTKDENQGGTKVMDSIFL